MKASYEDILGAIMEATGRDAKPLWHDENGTPRFAAHHPNLCPDIYATEVVLLLISCQSCGREFPVQMSWSMGSAVIMRAQRAVADLGSPRAGKEAMARAIDDTSLHAVVKAGTVHYGDPPNVGCCPAGPTMNCWDLKVLEFWSRNKPITGLSEWKRIPELEIDLPDLIDADRVGADA